MKCLKNNRWRYFGVLVLLLLVPGCTPASAPSAPLKINDIPVPPGSVIYTDPDEMTLDMTYMTTRNAFGVSNHNCRATALYYFLESAGYGLDEHLSFYQTAFATTDWRLDKTLALAGIRRWTRSSTAGAQTLTLGVIPFTRDDNSVDHILMMVLVTGELPCRP